MSWVKLPVVVSTRKSSCVAVRVAPGQIGVGRKGDAGARGVDRGEVVEPPVAWVSWVRLPVVVSTRKISSIAVRVAPGRDRRRTERRCGCPAALIAGAIVLGSGGGVGELGEAAGRRVHQEDLKAAVRDCPRSDRQWTERRCGCPRH